MFDELIQKFDKKFKDLMDRLGKIETKLDRIEGELKKNNRK